jgi:hypothetical protein
MSGKGSTKRATSCAPRVHRASRDATQAALAVSAHQVAGQGGVGDRNAPEEATVHIKTWHVEMFIYEDDDNTSVRAVLHTDSTVHREGHGRAVRAPHDTAVPEIGDEVAAARALHNLADVLLNTAAEDISEIEHRSVHLDFAGPTGVCLRVPGTVPVRTRA